MTNKFLYPLLVFVLGLSLDLGLAFGQNARQYKFDPLANMVVVGDIHADPLALLNILLSNDLIDAHGNWIARNTDVVLAGDLLDSGPDSIHTLDLIVKFKAEAARRGCRLLVARGNHDLMWFEDDFRYLTIEDRAVFKSIGANTSKQIAQLLADPTWPYAKELLDRQMFYKIGDVGIIHADLGSWALKNTPDQVNSDFREYTGQLLEAARRGEVGSVKAKGLMNSVYGPHFGRRLAEGKISQAEFDSYLKAWGVKYLVIGHTITDSFQPETRYNGRLIMVDTGISSGAGGQVWSIRGKREDLQRGQFEKTRFVRRNAEASRLLTKFKKERKAIRAEHNLEICGSTH